jgi:mono/diheme cytochrome c family protein
MTLGLTFNGNLRYLLSDSAEFYEIVLFKQCHGVFGKGDGPVSKKYGVKAASLSGSSKFLNNHTIFVQVAEGRGDMPQWVDVLTEEEIWALTHYMHTMK